MSDVSTDKISGAVCVCVDPQWQMVRCDSCGRDYRCTPSDDHYRCGAGWHLCEPCLLGYPAGTQLGYRVVDKTPSP